MSRRPSEARNPKVALATFGCKLNQWDSQNMRRCLARSCDIVDFDRRADLYVVNTCTVTSGSDAQARQLIRRTVRRRPGAKIVVTGCYAERARDELLSIEGVADVLGNAEKERLPDLVGRYLMPPGGSAEGATGGGAGKTAVSGPDGVEPLGASRGAAPGAAVGTEAGRAGRRRLHGEGPKFGRSRAHVAIQRGCDRRCAYCIVPSVRGPGRSYAPDRVVAEVEALLEEGYREIVLTGTYLGDYGADLSGRMSLPRLLKRLDEVVKGCARVRLSSLGPSDVTGELIEAVGECRSVCRHFHVAFQSGDDGVLEAMGRDYAAPAVHRALELIDESFPDCGLGGDAMAGFPGEDDRAFANTVEVVKSHPFSYLHVFVFSPRPGTLGEALPGRVRPGLAAERALALRELSVGAGLRFAARFVGRRIEVIAEGPSGKGDELVGTSGEYLRASFEGDPELKGRLVPVDVSGVLSARRVRGRTPAHQTSH